MLEMSQQDVAPLLETGPIIDTPPEGEPQGPPQNSEKKS
jgi:hypothetical protein